MWRSDGEHAQLLARPGERAGRAGGGACCGRLARWNDADAGKTSMWLTACNFMNGVVGAGIIGLPAAVNQAGLPLGIILCILVAVLSAWTVRLLGEVGAAHGVYTYPDLCQRAFGPAGFWTVCVFQGLFAFGAMCSYLVIFADTVPAVLTATTDWATTHPGAVDRRTILILGAFLILLPLCLLRRYSDLARFAVLKMFAITFLTGTVVWFRYDLAGEVVSVKSDEWKYEDAHAGFFTALGTVAFAFVCHHQTFLAYGSLANATQRRFALTVNLAITGSFTVSIVMAICGYLTFFESTKGDIFVNYEGYDRVRTSGLMNAARMMLALNMLVTYPSEMMVARQTFEALLDRRRKYSRWLALRAPVHDVVLLAQLKQQEDLDVLESADNWTCGQPLNRAMWEHVLLTLALFGASLGIAIGVTDLSKVLGITGSFTAVFLAFVLPAAIRLRLGPTPYDDLPLFHRNNLAAWVVLVFGAIAFVASTGVSVVEAVTGRDVVPVS